MLVSPKCRVSQARLPGNRCRVGGPRTTSAHESPQAGSGFDAGALEALDVDILIVGSGLAGIYAALSAAPYGRCLLLTKVRLELSNSAWAQGGIAVALDAEDDPQQHVEDTLRAGRGLCRPSAVDVLAREGPARIEELLRLGVPFDLDAGGRPLLGLEGGHGRRRIVHANGGATGQAVVAALLPGLLASPRITVWEDARAVGLDTADGRCVGALVERYGQRWRVRARSTILATGGAGGLYARTTNPPSAAGDGIALAYLAGAAAADMEFVQFHPTAFAQGRPAFLLTEALRGEGAELYNLRGERFMPRYDAAAELAPRDVVARAIMTEMAATGTDHVELRLDRLNPGTRAHFTRLFAALEARGLEPEPRTIPVAPAAHYLMGGIAVDVDGRTTVPGLFACGEVACTGVHGANRLASNSLLECLVFGRRAALAGADAPAPAPGAPTGSPLAALAGPDRRTLGGWLFADAGIVRTEAGLRELLVRLADLPPSGETLVASLIAQGALARTESRGAHFRADHPVEDPDLRCHFVQRHGQPFQTEVWE